jgi:hypothetical protein
MKQIIEGESPEYLSGDTSSSIQHKSGDENKYFDNTMYEAVGILNNVEWVLLNERRERKMITQTIEHNKIKLPIEFMEFIDKTAKEDDSTEDEIVKIGLTLLKLARKVKKDGLKLAIIDDGGTLLSTIDY